MLTARPAIGPWLAVWALAVLPGCPSSAPEPASPGAPLPRAEDWHKPDIELHRALARPPWLGLDTGQGVPVAIKGKRAATVQIEYRRLASASADEPQTVDARRSHAVLLDQASDFSATLHLVDIEPDTRHEYRVLIEGEESTQWYRFRSLPAPGQPAAFRFAFSACVRQKYRPHHVFHSIWQERASFLALMGDNMYADYDGDLNALEEFRSASPERREEILRSSDGVAGEDTVLAAFRNKYHRTFDDDYVRRVQPELPTLAIWDDHDFGEDNADGTYRYKRQARQAFLETFPAAQRAAGDSGGLHHSLQVGDVDLFVLDTRWYRTPPDQPQRTMLGRQQLHWLLDGLARSRAPFKLVLSSVSLNEHGADGFVEHDGRDNWSGYRVERQRIVDFVAERNITGVVFVSGDQHYPSAHVLGWTERPVPDTRTAHSLSFDLSRMPHAIWDFSASPLDYRRGKGMALTDEQQRDPAGSFELYRPLWAHPENHPHTLKSVVGNIYGVIDIDTRGAKKTLTVRFKELDLARARVRELFRVALRL